MKTILRSLAVLACAAGILEAQGGEIGRAHV